MRRSPVGEHFLDRFTIADISIAPTLSAAPMLDIDLAKYPNVTAWSARVASRPSYKKVFA